MKNLVIIPTYNEKDNISDMIDKIISLGGIDILVVDDNSPDGTSEIVKAKIKEHSEKVFIIERGGKMGLGTAYIEGFKYAIKNNYNFVFEMDADFSHNPDDLRRLRAELENENVDMVVGSRYITGVNVVNWPMSRVLLSYFASKYVKIVTGMKINDSTSGFVGYKIEVLKTINLDNIRFVGYAFQIEMKYKLVKLGFNIKEIPIIFTDRTKGESKMSKKIIYEAIFGIIGLRFKNILGILNK